MTKIHFAGISDRNSLLFMATQEELMNMIIDEKTLKTYKG